MRKRRFTVYISDKQHTAILEHAGRAGQSMSDWISHAITETLLRDAGSASTAAGPDPFHGKSRGAALFSDDEWDAAASASDGAPGHE